MKWCFRRNNSRKEIKEIRRDCGDILSTVADAVINDTELDLDELMESCSNVAMKVMDLYETLDARITKLESQKYILDCVMIRDKDY